MDAMTQNLSTWNESVSARARRLRLPIEHFIGYSLVCQWCGTGFRCFREFEPFCGGCRDMKGAPDGRF
jgi:hypothetical protein